MFCFLTIRFVPPLVTAPRPLCPHVLLTFMSFLQISPNRQFFLIEFHSMQGWTATTKDGVKIKRRKGKLYRKNPRKKVSINSRFKAIYIIGQRKAFCGQRTPESSYARKETVVIEILTTPRTKGGKKIMQPLE